MFALYDTYGFPVDLTNDIARERGYTLDMPGYEQAMAEQRQRARQASRFHVDYTAIPDIEGTTQFIGYEKLAGESRVTALFRGAEAVAELVAGEDGIAVLDTTPFYGESGGQVGDRGELVSARGRFVIRDCRKQGENCLHIGAVTEGALAVGDVLTARVDPATRAATARHHSATHLLHAALREVLGEHVTQKGSLVDAERARFDFSHPQALDRDQILAVERRVNREILANTEVQTRLMTMDVARSQGAMALFGEKYGDEVRVLTMGDGFSRELCGGTHVARTGDIGLFKIVTESGIASGVRRIEAIAGTVALAYVEELETRLARAASVLKTSAPTVVDKAAQLVEQNRQLARELDALKVRLAGASGGDPLAEACQVAGVSVLARRIEGGDARSLRDIVDQMKSRLGSGVVLLAAEEDGKVVLVAGVTKDLTGRIKAGDLMQHVAAQVGGKGGGRPDLAQGGGPDVGALAAALDSVPGWIEQRLGA